MARALKIHQEDNTAVGLENIAIPPACVAVLWIDLQTSICVGADISMVRKLAVRSAVYEKPVPDTPPCLFGYCNPNDSEGSRTRLSRMLILLFFRQAGGSAAGSVIAAALKLCANANTFFPISEDMDLGAGRIIPGDAGIPEVGREHYGLVMRVASGEHTRAEEWKHCKTAVRMSNRCIRSLGQRHVPAKRSEDECP